MVRVFLKKDVPNVGKAGEIKSVADGFAANFLVPRQLVIVVTAQNEVELQKRYEANKKKVVVSDVKSSQLADRISDAELVIKKKLHDDGKLYGAVSQQEVVDGLKNFGISIAKNQVVFEKSIKSKGVFSATIKLSSKLQPKITIKVTAEIGA